jgi:hypothetical protein
MLYLLFFLSCKKEDPVIAKPEELSYTTYSEYFVCQPVSFPNNFVAVVNKNNANVLCSYDKDGNTLWQHNIAGYVLSGSTFESVADILLEKDKQNNLLLLTYSVLQSFRAVKLDQNGKLLTEHSDYIHQHDTIFINNDTIAFSNTQLFKTNGFVGFSNGGYGVVSSQISAVSDTTYLQVSFYNNNLQFVKDSFLILTGKYTMDKVYSTSNNLLFFTGNLEGSGRIYFMMDLGGKILFENKAPGLLDTYFFFENSKGNYIVSALYVDQSIIPRGVVFCIDKLGKYQWGKAYDFSPSWVMLSIQEESDGYLLSGFSTESLLLTGVDWRKSFLEEEHHAIIQKIDLFGSEQWNMNIPGKFFSAGAISIGDSPISFFGG